MSGIATLICGLNLYNVKVFGEMEFWLALIKITAVGTMIVDGTVILFPSVKMNSGHVSSLSNLRSHDGFLPRGVDGLVASSVVVMFAYGGAEVTDIIDGETQDPDKAVPKVINAVPTRILLFYMLTMYMLMAVFLWTDIDGQSSPFV